MQPVPCDRAARNRRWIAEVDALLAELDQAETAAGDMTGTIRAVQHPASRRIDRAHAALDVLESA